MFSSKLFNVPVRPLLVALFVLSNSACSKRAPSDEAQKSASKLQWRQLTDGSFAEGIDRPGEVENRRRCWPTSNGFDCVIASGMNGDGSILRWQIPILATEIGDANATPPLSGHGYACDYLSQQKSIVETASGPNGDMRDNVVSLNGITPHSQPWSPRKASEALAQVGSTQLGTHFDCMEIASQIFSKGIRALESPSITGQILN